MNHARKITPAWGQLLLRATRSTLIISVVAMAVAALRRGGMRWTEVKFLVAQWWWLAVMIFFALVIWDYWFQRTRP